MRDITNNTKISIVSPHQFDVLYPDPSEVSNGAVLVACIKNMELWVCPPPDGSDVFELDYDRMGVDASAVEVDKMQDEDGFYLLDEAGGFLLGESSSTYTAGFGWLPEIERFRCCDFALSRAFASLLDWEGATFYYKKWKEGLKKAARSDGKRRYSTFGYRARSVFQA